MSTKQELIEEALLLPMEDRAYIIESLIKSMNPVDPDIDLKWIEVSKRRLNELKSREVKGVPCDEVLGYQHKTGRYAANVAREAVPRH